MNFDGGFEVFGGGSLCVFNQNPPPKFFNKNNNLHYYIYICCECCVFYILYFKNVYVTSRLYKVLYVERQKPTKTHNPPPTPLSQTVKTTRKPLTSFDL